TWGAVLVLLSVLALLARRERRSRGNRPADAGRSTARFTA
ncbi:MAG: hypothetical protein JWP96_726, partial [Polaromonas sp.]|nr:hypothetical protein [Polaromonas sp.]